MRGRQRGVALLIVLWVVALLSVLVATLLKETRLIVQATKMQVDLMQARETARGAVYRQIATMLDGVTIETSAEPDTETRVRVTVVDEGTKVDLNTGLADAIEQRLTAVLRDTDPGAVTAQILDWRDTDPNPREGGAERSDYRSAGLPYGPRDGPFLDVREIHQVLGLSKGEHPEIAQHFTVVSGQRQAGHVASEYLPGRAYTVNATAEVGRARARAIVTIRLTAQPEEPYVILAWRWAKPEPSATRVSS